MTSPQAQQASLPALTPAGQRLLDAASDLFYRRGIRAVGVDLIAATAGTTKKTLYDRFGSKDGLVVLYLQRRQARWREYVSRHLDETADAFPAERVLAVLDALEGWMSQQQRGCAFVNAYAELGGTDHPAVDVIRAEKEWTRELYRRLCAESGFDSPDDLATALQLVHEGVLVLTTAGGQTDAFRHGRAAAQRLLSAAHPR